MALLSWICGLLKVNSVKSTRRLEVGRELALANRRVDAAIALLERARWSCRRWAPAASRAPALPPPITPTATSTPEFLDVEAGEVEAELRAGISQARLRPWPHAEIGLVVVPVACTAPPVARASRRPDRSNWAATSAASPETNGLDGRLTIAPMVAWTIAMLPAMPPTAAGCARCAPPSHRSPNLDEAVLDQAGAAQPGRRGVPVFGRPSLRSATRMSGCRFCARRGWREVEGRRAGVIAADHDSGRALAVRRHAVAAEVDVRC